MSIGYILWEYLSIIIKLPVELLTFQKSNKNIKGFVKWNIIKYINRYKYYISDAIVNRWRENI